MRPTGVRDRRRLSTQGRSSNVLASSFSAVHPIRSRTTRQDARIRAAMSTGLSDTDSKFREFGRFQRFASISLFKNGAEARLYARSSRAWLCLFIATKEDREADALTPSSPRHAGNAIDHPTDVLMRADV
jgi:hypothetical protein